MTIGWGRNIEDNGISQEEGDFMFDNDYARCEQDLSSFHWYTDQPDDVKAALMNMCFNLGLTRLLGFRKMISALIDKDYARAANEAIKSKWATQVGQRAMDVALMIREAQKYGPKA